MTKMIKMSLVAAVAVAGLNSTASAKPLEEAIKGVDVSGAVRYRYEHKEDNTVGTSTSDVASTTKNDYDLDITLNTPVNDMVAFTVKTEADADTYDADGDVNVHLTEGYFTANTDVATVMAGKQNVPGPFDDGLKGTGLVALIPAGPVTLAAGHFENTTVGLGLGNGHANAYAAIASFGDIKADLWYMNATDVWAGTSLHVNAPVGPVTIDARHTTGEISSKVNNQWTDSNSVAHDLTSDEATLTTVKVSGKAAGISLSGVFAASGADNGQGLNRVSVDNSVESTTDIGALAWNTNGSQINDGTFIVLAASKAVAPKTTATVKYATLDYGSTKYENDGAEKMEIIAQVNYKMSKNLSTYFRYAEFETKASKTATVVDASRSRIEVKYTF